MSVSEDDKLEIKNEELIRTSEEEKLEQSSSEENILTESISVNSELEPYSSGGKIFTLKYFNHDISVFLSKSDINNLKKGIGFEAGPGEIVNVQTYKKVTKTVKKAVTKKVMVAKINKYSKKLIWNSKYFGKTIKYALKYKYTSTYKKTKGKYIIIYQKYKGYKKVKKTTYKKVWAKKDLIVNAFKVSEVCETPKGYYIGFSYPDADREFIWEYKISI